MDLPTTSPDDVKAILARGGDARRLFEESHKIKRSAIRFGLGCFRIGVLGSLALFTLGIFLADYLDRSHNINRSRDETVTFLVVGGWGTSPEDSLAAANASRTARGMAAVASRLRPAFVISTGDNLPNGLSSGLDPRLPAARAPFRQGALANLTWHAVLGDRDYLGNASAEAAAGEVDSRWELHRGGALEIAHAARAPSWPSLPRREQALARIAFLDTTPWTPAARAAGSPADLSDLTPVAPPSATAAEAWALWGDAQIAALADALRSPAPGAAAGALAGRWARAPRWALAVGHDCLASVGPRGPQPGLRRVEAALRAGGTALYICGGEQNQQVLTADLAKGARGPAHLVSGAGARGDGLKPWLAKKSNAGGTKAGAGKAAAAGGAGAGAGAGGGAGVAKAGGVLRFASSGTGFAAVRVSAVALRVELYDSDGGLLYVWSAGDRQPEGGDAGSGASGGAGEGEGDGSRPPPKSGLSEQG